MPLEQSIVGTEGVAGNAVASGDRLLILPMGEIKGRDGRYWNLTPEDAQSVVNTIQGDGVDIVLDFDHSTCWGGGEAAGWLKNFAVDESGVTAELEFTASGQANVDEKKRRYISPAFHADSERILRLHSVGLVNTPNIAELPSMNNMGGGTPPPAPPAPPAPAAPSGGSDGMQQQINQLLGAVQHLTEQNASLARSLESMQHQGREQAVGTLIENAIADGRIAPAQREHAMKMGLADANALKQFLGAAPKQYGHLTSNQAAGAAGAGGASQGGQAANGLTDVDLEVCRVMNLKPEDYAAQVAAADKE